MERLFFDTDIVLDVLAKREPYFQYAAALLSKSDRGEVRLGVSSLSFSNLNYILSKQLGSSKTRKVLIKLKSLVEVVAVEDVIIDLSLASDFKDFKDAIQYNCAIKNAYSTLITRNLKDYKTARIPVMTAESFVKM